MREVLHSTGALPPLELAAWPPGATAELAAFEWSARLWSVEARGSIPAFPGCERCLVVTRGAGLLLDTRGLGRARLRALEPRRFPGDLEADIEPAEAAVTVLEVLTRRGGTRAELQASRLGARRAREALAGQQALLLVVAGALVARVTGEEQPFALAGGHSLWLRGLDGGEELELEGRGPQAGFVLASIELARPGAGAPI
jgi:environmental stress-induced protein Ves